jgi:hypothetical protein
MSEVCIRSARDGTTLTLSERVAEHAALEDGSFRVSFRCHDMHAEALVSSYFATDLGVFFGDLAANWRGWKGERRWGSLEEEFWLSALSDSTGHITLRCFLRAPYTGFHWEVNGALELEAGQLDSLAADVAAFWRGSAT